MRFEKILPCEPLQPYIRYFVVAENPDESTYKVFPSTALVIGFQYRGQLKSIANHQETSLTSAGITGISDHYKTFRNSAGIGTILVYFTEIGLSHFTTCPANELFNQSIGLDNLFNKDKIRETEEKLAFGKTDKQRIHIIEHFLVSQLKEARNDQLILKAVSLIYQSKGSLRIKELQEQLCISQSPFEKRFRKLVGTSPKKFSNIIRFNLVLNQLNTGKSLTEICYENHFFDQAHFIKDFKQFTGDTPENFKRFL